MNEEEYILGTDRDEIERLRFQHKVWVEQAYALWGRAELRAGQTVLDLGCGPGFTSFELAHLVGPQGRVIARDKSERFLEFLRAECARETLTQVEASLGPVEEIDLPPQSLDAAYARWLFCWLEDPTAVLRRVAAGLKPGGVVALQEYLDWGAMKLIPASPELARAVEACMTSWSLGGGIIDIGNHLPTMAAECGLEVEVFDPLARIGPPGSLPWRWLTEFFHSYLPKLVEPGLITEDEVAAHARDWAERTAAGASFVYAPLMVDVLLRKPA